MKIVTQRKGVFSLENALAMATASQWAYKSYNDFIATCKQFGFIKERYFYIERRNIIVVIFGDDNNIVVAYRGTDAKSLKDWGTDFNIFMSNQHGSEGRVHSGFYNALMLTIIEIKQAIKLLRDKHQKIFITGHSMGGGIATLLGHKLTTGTPLLPSTVYTFGAPKVGNGIFVEEFSVFCTVFRVVHSNDLTPRLMGIYYNHVGDEYYFNYRGCLIFKPSFVYRMYDHLMSRIKAFRFFGGIRDHSISLYVQAIQKAIDDCTEVK